MTRVRFPRGTILEQIEIAQDGLGDQASRANGIASAIGTNQGDIARHKVVQQPGIHGAAADNGERAIKLQQGFFS